MFLIALLFLKNFPFFWAQLISVGTVGISWHSWDLLGSVGTVGISWHSWIVDACKSTSAKYPLLLSF